MVFNFILFQSKHLYFSPFYAKQLLRAEATGQTKSKRFFQADVSSEKQMKEFYFTTMKPQVDLFLFVFFEEIEDTNEIN